MVLSSLLSISSFTILRAPCWFALERTFGVKHLPNQNVPAAAARVVVDGMASVLSQKSESQNQEGSHKIELISSTGWKRQRPEQQTVQDTDEDEKEKDERDEIIKVQRKDADLGKVEIRRSNTCNSIHLSGKRRERVKILRFRGSSDLMLSAHFKWGKKKDQLGVELVQDENITSQNYNRHADRRRDERAKSVLTAKLILLAKQRKRTEEEKA